MRTKAFIFGLFSLMSIGALHAQISPESFVGNPNDWSDKADKTIIGTSAGFNILASDSRASSAKPSGFEWRFKLSANGYAELPELTNLGDLVLYVAGGSGTQVGGTTMDYDSITIDRWMLDEDTGISGWEMQTYFGKAMPKAETLLTYTYSCNSSTPVKLRIFNASGQSIWIYCMKVTPFGQNIQTTLPYSFNESDMPSASAGSVPEPTASTNWQSSMLSIDGEGKPTYHQDADGFILPDFSHAGYKNGNASIPDVAVVKTLTAVEGDNTAQIQAAIDEIGTIPLNGNGIRGALLLKAGLYEVKGPIYVNYDGIVLRGEGNGANPANNTVIYDSFRDASGYDAWRNVLILGNKTTDNWNTNKNNEENILDDVVPVGSKTVRIARNENYQVGDQVCIYHPCSENWLQAVGYGEVGDDPTVYKPWTTSSTPIYYRRQVTKVTHLDTETLVEFDAPVFYTLQKSLSQSVLYRFTRTAMQNIGLENLRVDCAAKTIPDECHAWNCVAFKNADNCWARDVVTTHFGQAGFVTQNCTAITIERCFALDPIGVVTGERMYNFNTAQRSQLILFKDCYARAGRHNYISNGTSTVSGCVVYNCKSEGSRASSEGHRLWTQGMLFDKYQDFNPISSSSVAVTLGFYNRWRMGSGHGWGMANGVMWNCNMVTDHTTAAAQKNSPVSSKTGIYCEKPPTSQNYAIGCFVETATDVKKYKKNLGYVEGTNVAGLYPSSLYEWQLTDRLQSTTSVNNIKETTPNFYVNAAGTELTVLYDQPIQSLRIFNLGGILLHEEKPGLRNLTISLGSLNPGLYLVQIKTEIGSFNHKIIK